MTALESEAATVAAAPDPGLAKRTGGHVVVEALEALGAEVAFGVPGIHALAIWEALRTSPIHEAGLRTELAAGFAADGYARASGRAAPLLLSTGPGALNSLTAIMEAASSHVPVVAISSQIPTAMLGRGRGFLHELHDQLASFAPIVKHARVVTSADAIPEAIAEAWRIALSAPSGPVYLEIPVDVLTAPVTNPPVRALDAAPPPRRVPPAAALAAAAEVLAGAARVAVWAGGGVARSGASAEVAEIAERLAAPVAMTYMGKGALPDDHPLCLGSGCDEAAVQDLLATADAVLAVGTELGAETTGQYALRLGGTLVQIDAAAERIGTTYPALGLVGDARATLEALLERLPAQARPDGAARERVAAARARIGAGLDEQGRDEEREMLRAIRAALPDDAVTAWDMTILAYWAAAHYSAPAPRRFLYPLGSGTLGYAWPAAIGAALALPGTPAIAVVGDGGILYALAELASARQHGAEAKLVLVDDRGYGILREYQSDAYGVTNAVDLTQPDFVAVAEAFGVPVRSGAPAELPALLEWALELDGPAVVVVRAKLVAAAPTS